MTKLSPQEAHERAMQLSPAEVIEALRFEEDEQGQVTFKQTDFAVMLIRAGLVTNLFPREEIEPDELPGRILLRVDSFAFSDALRAWRKEASATDPYSHMLPPSMLGWIARGDDPDAGLQSRTDDIGFQARADDLCYVLHAAQVAISHPDAYPPTVVFHADTLARILPPWGLDVHSARNALRDAEEEKPEDEPAA